jgi:DNA-binding transcriptional ArsR family regulator
MQVMSALSQPTRLEVYRRLVTALPNGIAAGELAAAVKAAPSAMSAHLAILSRAGLVKSVKSGRSVVYRAVITPLDGLVDFLSDVRQVGDGSRR